MGEESGFTVYEDFAPAVLPFFFLYLHFPFQESVLMLGLLTLGFSCKRTVKSIETSV